LDGREKQSHGYEKTRSLLLLLLWKIVNKIFINQFKIMALKIHSFFPLFLVFLFLSFFPIFAVLISTFPLFFPYIILF